MRKKVLTSVIAFGILISLSTTIFADPVSDEQHQKDIINQNTNKLNEANKATQSFESSIEALDESIAATTDQISSNKTKIENIKVQMTKVQSDIAEAQVKVDEEQALFDNRMRAVYIQGNDGAGGYLSVLLESNGMSDFLSRIETVKKLADLDKKIQADLKSQQDVVKVKKLALDTDKAKLETLATDNETKLAKLNSDRQAQVVFVTQAKAVEGQYKADIDKATAAIALMKTQVPKLDVSRGAAPISSNAIVSYAYNFINIPYVWGGNSPSPGFDCSGFTKYVFAHFGVSLYRVAVDQASQGASVSRDNLQPGDLVFFGSSMRTIHHVGIYVGNGCYIHAPHTGTVIQVSSMSRSDFIIGKRVY